MRNRTVVTAVVCAGGLAAGAGWTARVLDQREQEREVLAAVESLYSVISGDAGEARDWDAFRAKFFDDRASMTFTIGRENEDGSYAWSYGSMTPDQYVERAGAMFETSAFHERAVANRVEIYGAIAHVWSTYAATHSADGSGEPFAEGINSIQLVKMNDGWKVLSLAWADEHNAGEIPERYRGED